MIRGKVVFYHRAKFYGFVRVEGYRKDVFFHLNDVQAERELQEGEEVEITKIHDEPNGLKAETVIPTNKAKSIPGMDQSRLAGVVTSTGTKHYGFIRGNDMKDYLFHYQNVDNGVRLQIGDTVSFSPYHHRKGLEARFVKLLTRGKGKQERKKPALTTQDKEFDGLLDQF